MTAALAQETCTYCHRLMADGGAPLPGEGRGVNDRACATCHDRFRRGLPLITKPTRLQPEPVCDHGVSLFEPCTPCDLAIEGQDDEEIIE